MSAIRRLSRVSIAAAWLLTGCAAATATSVRGNGTQLTQSQLAAANADNLYDAIVKLHPEWLSSRGATSVTDSSPTGVDIYMNGTLLGKADYMRGVRLLDV